MYLEALILDALNRASLQMVATLADEVVRDRRIVAAHVVQFNAQKDAAEFQEMVYRQRIAKESSHAGT